MRERTEDDKWFDRVQKLSEGVHGNDSDGRMLQIARQEADKQIAAAVVPVLCVGAVW